MDKRIKENLAKAKTAFEEAFEAFSEAHKLKRAALDKLDYEDDDYDDKHDEICDAFTRACQPLYDVVDNNGWSSSTLHCWES